MYLIGDTHGLRPVFSIVDRLKLTGQNLVHVGDFGLGFVSIAQDLKNLEATDEMLMDTNNHLYVIRGNHDNPIFWDRSKGLNLPRLHNLHLVDDYSVIKIEGKNVLFIGGATSIDRRPRMDDVPYPSWWADEIFKLDPEKLGKIFNRDVKIDVVVTHTAPSFCYPIGSKNDLVDSYVAIEKAHGEDLRFELEHERGLVDTLYNDLTMLYNQRPTHWFYGHFHSSRETKKDGTLFKLLNINEVYELK